MWTCQDISLLNPKFAHLKKLPMWRSHYSHRWFFHTWSEWFSCRFSGYCYVLRYSDWSFCKRFIKWENKSLSSGRCTYSSQKMYLFLVQWQLHKSPMSIKLIANKRHFRPIKIACLKNSPMWMGIYGSLTLAILKRANFLGLVAIFLDISLADPGAAPPARAPPTGSNSFFSTYVFAEKHTCRRLAPPQQVGTPPMENPGSATAYSHWLFFQAIFIFMCTEITRLNGYSTHLKASDIF